MCVEMYIFGSYRVTKTYEKLFFRTLRRFDDVLHVYMNFHAHELELYWAPSVTDI